MSKKNYFFRIDASEFLAAVVKVPHEDRAAWVLQLALDLVADDKEVAGTEYAKVLIDESNGFREKRKVSGRLGGLAKASTAKAKASTAKVCSSKSVAKASEPLANSNSNSSNNNNKTPSSSGDDGFGEFWLAYPRKTGKGAAQKSWAKLKPPVDEVLRAVEKQKKSRQWTKDDGQFIPHPSTWLNQRRWEDEVEAAVVEDDFYSAPIYHTR